MNLKKTVAGLLLAVALPIVAADNILPEDAFWNKETAYVPAAPAAGSLVVAMSLASSDEDLEWVYDTSARPAVQYSAVASEPAPDYVFETMAGHWSYISPLIRFSSFEPTGLILLFK